MPSSTQAKAHVATVEDVTSSPSPSPPPSAAGAEEPINQPIDSLGDDSDEDEDDDQDAERKSKGRSHRTAGGSPSEADDDEEDVWDPSVERLPGSATSKGKSKAKGKGKRRAGDDGEDEDEPAESRKSSEEQPWQAVWSPEQKAWYFWNQKSGEVTWTNPLAPADSGSTQPPLPDEAPPLPTGPAPSSRPPQASSSSSYTTHAAAEPRFGIAPDIDPDLAYLLHPSQRINPNAVADAALSSGSGPGLNGTGGVTAAFNARTGRFTGADYSYGVEHLDEYNRAKRMNSHYFDVDAWEKQRAEEYAKRKRDEEMGVDTRQKITKKDMERFRRKAAEKKHRSQAWLRD